MSNKLVRWVVEKHGVNTFKEFEEKFLTEEIYFNSVVYSVYSVADLQAEATTDIVGGESEYRLHHKESGDVFETDYEEIERLHVELSKRSYK